MGKVDRLKCTIGTNGSTKLNSDTLNKCKSSVKSLCFPQASPLATVLELDWTHRSFTKNHQVQH